MGSFITGTELKTIRHKSWESWEEVTIRKFSQAQSDVMDKELIELAGTGEDDLRTVVQPARVPVLVAGVASWTLRVLSDEQLMALYLEKANSLKKEASELSDEERKAAVASIPMAPLNRETLGQLNPTYAGFISMEIRLFNRERSKEEQQEFLQRLRGGAVGKGEAAPSGNDD